MAKDVHGRYGTIAVHSALVVGRGIAARPAWHGKDTLLQPPPTPPPPPACAPPNGVASPVYAKFSFGRVRARDASSSPPR